MIWIPGGTFRMGSDKHYPEEAPGSSRHGGRLLDGRHPVTNREFRRFVNATGYVTLAEIKPDPKDYPGALPHMTEGGFAGLHAARSCGRHARLQPVVEFQVRRQLAPSLRASKSTISGLDDHPVVHVAYLRCAGLRQVGRQGAADRSGMGVCRAWRSRRRGICLGRRIHARRHVTWPTPGRESFLARISTPTASSAHRRSRHFRRMAMALHDMIGNVWEWTTDWYSPKHQADAPKACCIPENPRGGRRPRATTRERANVKIPRKVIKGGSHLCAPNYCRRYRPAARHAEPVDTSTSHLGFRCITANKRSERAVDQQGER